jgi:alpha-L-fucosidase
MNMQIKTNTLLAVCLLFLSATGCTSQTPVEPVTKSADPTAGFAGKWGVMFHYLATPAGTVPEGTTAEDWFEKINNFDVEGLADQLDAVGADYFIITVGQGAGYFLAPNAAYDTFLGTDQSRCPERDLVAEIADALNARGIQLIVYTASDLGWGDPTARAALGMTSHHNDHRMGLRDPDTPNDPQANREGQVEFLKKWETIHEEWSQRWGDRIAGWWVDGCYHQDIRFPGNEPPNLETMKAALRVGNPDAIVAFNGGKGVRAYSKYDDFTAGEVSKISRDFPENPTTWYENDGQRVRLHVLTYLGRKWGLGEPRFTDGTITQFAAQIASLGGFLSLDLPPEPDGRIPEAFLPQLKLIGESIEKSERQ